jgi:hypothetical protein
MSRCTSRPPKNDRFTFIVVKVSLHFEYSVAASNCYRNQLSDFPKVRDQRIQVDIPPLPVALRSNMKRWEDSIDWWIDPTATRDRWEAGQEISDLVIPRGCFQ